MTLNGISPPCFIYLFCFECNGELPDMQSRQNNHEDIKTLTYTLSLVKEKIGKPFSLQFLYCFGVIPVYFLNTFVK